MSPKNLWADLSEVELIRAPKRVLIEQAQYLTQATKGTLVGKVDDQSANASSGFRYDLDVRVPALNNYSVTILRIFHDVDLYPVSLIASRPSKNVSCANEAEFEKAIESVLSSSEVKALLSRLLSQLK